MKIPGTLARWLFILCLPVLFITASIAGAVNSRWLYSYGFAKYQISQATGLPTSELKKAATGLIDYFNSNQQFISVTVVKDGKPMALFNQREIVHLKDVKDLIHLDYTVALGTLVYALAFAGISLAWHRKRYWRSLARAAVWGSGITLGLMLLLALGSLFNFDQLFLQFHLLSFSNDFWQLDPARDYLIMLFPQGFWYDATMFIAISTAGMSLIIGGVSERYWLASRQPPASPTDPP